MAEYTEKVRVFLGKYGPAMVPYSIENSKKDRDHSTRQVYLLLLWQDQGEETGPSVWPCDTCVKMVAGGPGPSGPYNTISVVRVKSAA